MLIKNTYRNYTPEEILQVLQEEYKILSAVDPEVDTGMDITKGMTIKDWRNSLDFLPWDKLYKARNAIFKISEPYASWIKEVWPERKKTVWDMCIFIARFAQKEEIKPINIFGRECLGAAVFMTLRKNISLRKIDVKNLRPSTPLELFLEGSNFPYVIPEIITLGGIIFETFRYRLKDNLSFWQKVNIFNPYRYKIDTGSIRTFKDLSKKIAQNLLSQENNPI